MGIINKMAPIIPAIQYSQKYSFLNILHSEKLYRLILIASEYSLEIKNPIINIYEGSHRIDPPQIKEIGNNIIFISKDQTNILNPA